MNFGAFTFSGGSGKSTTFNAPLRGVQIGAQMAFLVALAAFARYVLDGHVYDEDRRGVAEVEDWMEEDPLGDGAWDRREVAGAYGGAGEGAEEEPERAIADFECW